MTPRRDESGASAVEYGLMLGAIAAVAAAAVFALGGAVLESYEQSACALTTWITNAQC